MTNADLIKYYRTAKEYIILAGYVPEIKHVMGLSIDKLTPEEFLHQYVYVVVNSGMKNQVAEKIFERFCKEGLPAIGHPGKRGAIDKALQHYKYWHKQFMAADDKVEYLVSLPWIGDITKYHLARNIGLDVAKPDRHLVRIAKGFGYDDVNLMCRDISNETGDRIGVVDVVLWRFCNLGEPVK